MGTSSDRTAGTGGDWTLLKRATHSYVNSLGGRTSRDRALRVLARHVPLLGGAAAAASSAVAGVSGAQRFGALLSEVGQAGLGFALESLGLGDLVGRDRFTVVDELVTFVAGVGDDLDAQAARDAACEVLEELFGDADTWDELSEVSVSAEQLAELLERFVAAYIYNRVPVVAERLSRLVDPAAMRAADLEMREIIEGFTAIYLEDPFSLDWAGHEGRAAIDDAMRDAYQIIAELEN